jgi:hypothetical protein
MTTEPTHAPVDARPGDVIYDPGPQPITWEPRPDTDLPVTWLPDGRARTGQVFSAPAPSLCSVPDCAEEGALLFLSPGSEQLVRICHGHGDAA